jgi:ATP-binding cassette subfamily B protein
MKQWTIGILLCHWRPLSTIVLLQMGCALLVSLQPRYYQQIVSLAIEAPSDTLLNKGLPFIGLLASLYAGAALLMALGGRIGCTFSYRILNQLQSDFFEKIIHLPLQSFQGESTGSLFTRFNHDVGQTQQFLAGFVPTAIRESITVLAVTVILLVYCPPLLTVVALGIVLAMATAVASLNRVMERYAIRQRRSWTEINKLFDEAVKGIETLKLFAGEHRMLASFRRQTARYQALSIRAGSIVSVFSPGVDFMSKMGGLLLVLLAYVQMSSGIIQIDPFLLFFFYVTLLQTAVFNLVAMLSNIQVELTGLRNLARFFEGFPQEDIDEKETATSFPSAQLHQSVSIELINLHFTYPGQEPLYRRASLSVPARAVTVIIGPSGSGKSTLINLLLRFYTPQQGEIRIGDMKSREFSRRELRTRIGVVTQDHYIFNKSLRENLLVAKPQANDDEIKQALKQARLEGFLSRLPGGLDTIMHPDGRGMSAGEKQRVCLARLLLKQSPIIILDEPWSHLEMPARHDLAAVINACKATTTVLLLTHDIHTKLAYDLIYYLDPDKGTFIPYDDRLLPEVRHSTK